MAHQLVANESTPLLSPDPLHPTVEQQVKGGGPVTISMSSGSNTVIQPSIEGVPLSPSTSSGSSTMIPFDDDDENVPLLPSRWPNLTSGDQQTEERELSPHATLHSPRVEDGSTPPFSGPLYPHDHGSPLPSLPEELSPDIQYSVGYNIVTNILVQQAVIRQQRSFSLSDPTQSSIMLRRNARTERASAGRSSTSQGGLQNVTPQRAKKLISTLGFDDQRSEFFLKLVIATAPFHKPASQPAPPAPKVSNPEADTLRETLGNLIFAPNVPGAGAAEEDPIAGNGTENPTGNLLFDAIAAENLASRRLEARSDSPPLLWSTAMAEEQLDPNAEEPTQYTVAEFINTINENKIQVESVNEDDWWIEEIRVAILNRLMNDTEEDLAAEGDPNEVVETTEEASERVTVNEDLPNPVMGHVKTNEDTSEPDPTAEGNSNQSAVAKGKATENVKAREDTSKSDQQRWKEQGPKGWLKKADGTELNDEEVDEECARFDAMVRKARTEKAIQEVAERSRDSTSTHGQDENASVSAHDQDGEASEKKNKKGSRKNKNKNRKAKKNALKGGEPEDLPEEVPETETLRLQNLDFGETFDSLAEQINAIGLAVGDDNVTTSDGVEMPQMNTTEGGVDEGKEEDNDMLGQDSGLYTPSVYSEYDEAGRLNNTASRSTTSMHSDPNSELEREILGLMDAIRPGASE